MCGRFVLEQSSEDLRALFEIDEYVTELPVPNWNIPPQTQIAVVIEAKNREPSAAQSSATRSSATHRRLEQAKWGLVPLWAKDEKIGARAINARSETVTSKPMFREAFAKRRALIPADGYYEWQKHADGKTPFFIHGSELLAFAGLYEWWRRADGSWLLSTTILTDAAHGKMRAIHDRIPLILPREHWNEWIDPNAPGNDALLENARSATAAFSDELQLHEVDPAVGNVRNNSPHLIEPLRP
ncbi:SOS response-associated peptidase [Humidisolicoccus flavus]|uniref:SOS response-associated peptidase n=1 Tax=Humidisolicoccus flavus TaxID=3111414 RepID=UPI00324D1FAA